MQALSVFHSLIYCLIHSQSFLISCAALPCVSNSVTAFPLATARENARRSPICTGEMESPYTARASWASNISGARAGQALRTKAAGFPAAFTMSTLAATADRSNAVGRHGISMKSDEETAIAAPGAAWGAV